MAKLLKCAHAKLIREQHLHIDYVNQCIFFPTYNYNKKKELSKIKNCKYENNIKNNCKNADLIILLTEWDEFKAIDFKKINKNRNLKIYDLRNLYNLDQMKDKKMKYYSVGRPDIN